MNKKAEEKAIEAYPDVEVKDELDPDARLWITQTNNHYRSGFVRGYEEAEKDLELTWEDVWRIGELHEEVKNDFCDNPSMFDLKGYDVTPENFKRVFSEEVLRRFNEEKDNGQE